MKERKIGAFSTGPEQSFVFWMNSLPVKGRRLSIPMGIYIMQRMILRLFSFMGMCSKQRRSIWRWWWLSAPILKLPRVNCWSISLTPNFFNPFVSTESFRHCAWHFNYRNQKQPCRRLSRVVNCRSTKSIILKF